LRRRGPDVKSLLILIGMPSSTAADKRMRAETQNLVEDIKRSLGLLRRHL